MGNTAVLEQFCSDIPVPIFPKIVHLFRRFCTFVCLQDLTLKKVKVKVSRSLIAVGAVAVRDSQYLGHS